MNGIGKEIQSILRGEGSETKEKETRRRQSLKEDRSRDNSSEGTTEREMALVPTQQRDVTLAQSNLLTQSRHDFTVIEKRAFYFVVNEVRKQFIERHDGGKTLFNNLIVHIETSYLTGHDMNLREVYDGMKRLRKREFFIEDEEKVLEVGFINYFEHRKRNPYLEVEVSNKILPYLVELASHFTAYSLTVAITLQSKFTQRFYEFCSQYEFSDTNRSNANSGYFFATVKDLRRKLMLENTYIRYAAFKENVVDKAQKELKELYEAGHCNLYFEYKEEKYGRTVEKLHFKIYSKNMKKIVIGEKNINDQLFYIRMWLSSWMNAENRPKNKKWIDKVITHISLHPPLCIKLYKRLEKIKKEELPGENNAALARHIIEEDILP